MPTKPNTFLAMSLTIAAAQSISLAGNIPANVSRHLSAMQVAENHGVQLLVFPELSLTGYEMAMARELAIRPDDHSLIPLREQARRSGMTAVVGAPLRSADDDSVFIAALVLHPDGSVGVYTKQYLHAGEEVAFTAGDGGLTLTVGDASVALAVCADSLQPAHAARAAESNADVYAVGSVISTKSYPAESKRLRSYAVDHEMAVLLANHGAMTGGWACAGRSAIWAAGGELIAAAPGLGERLVIATRESGQWKGQVVPLAA